MRARADLARELNEAIEPTHCPVCGIFQPDMVRLLRKQYGKQYDPNKYASERIAVPIMDALRAANAENTVESFTKFMETWPYVFFRSYAQDRIERSKISATFALGYFPTFGGSCGALLSCLLLGWSQWLRPFTTVNNADPFDRRPARSSRQTKATESDCRAFCFPLTKVD